MNKRESDDEIDILRGAAEWCRRWSQDLSSILPRPDLQKAARVFAESASDFDLRAAALEKEIPTPGEAGRERALRARRSTRTGRKAPPPWFWGSAAACPALPELQDRATWRRFGDLAPEELRELAASQRKHAQAVVRTAQKTRASATLACDIAAATAHTAATLRAAAKQAQNHTLGLFRQAWRSWDVSAPRQSPP